MDDSTRTLAGHGNLVHVVCFSPDGSTLVSASNRTDTHEDDTDYLDDVDDMGNLILRPGAKPQQGWEFSSTVVFWDVRSGAATRRATLPDHVRSLCYSADGALLIVCRIHHVEIWDARTAAVVKAFHPPFSFTYCAAISPGGGIVGAVGDEGVLWDARTGEQLRSWRPAPMGVPTYKIAFMPDGERVVTGAADYTAKVWDVRSGKLLATMERQGRVDSVAVSPDGETVAVVTSSPNSLSLWNASTGVKLHEFSGIDARVLLDYISGIAFTSDGEMLVAGSADGVVRVRRVRGARECVLELHAAGAIQSIAVSPDDRTIAGGTYEHEIKLWEIGTLDGAGRPRGG